MLLVFFGFCLVFNVGLFDSTCWYFVVLIVIMFVLKLVYLICCCDFLLILR